MAQLGNCAAHFHVDIGGWRVPLADELAALIRLSEAVVAAVPADVLSARRPKQL